LATRQDLVRRALALLNADGGAGQEPSAEDYQRVDQAVPSVLAELRTDGTVYVSYAEAIDDAILDPLARILAAARAEDFGGARDEAAVETAKLRIRRITASRPTYEPQRGVYF